MARWNSAYNSLVPYEWEDVGLQTLPNSDDCEPLCLSFNLCLFTFSPLAIRSLRSPTLWSQRSTLKGPLLASSPLGFAGFSGNACFLGSILSLPLPSPLQHLVRQLNYLTVEVFGDRVWRANKITNEAALFASFFSLLGILELLFFLGNIKSTNIKSKTNHIHKSNPQPCRSRCSLNRSDFKWEDYSRS